MQRSKVECERCVNNTLPLGFNENTLRPPSAKDKQKHSHELYIDDARLELDRNKNGLDHDATMSLVSEGNKEMIDR